MDGWRKLLLISYHKLCEFHKRRSVWEKRGFMDEFDFGQIIRGGYTNGARMVACVDFI